MLFAYGVGGVIVGTAFFVNFLPDKGLRGQFSELFQRIVYIVAATILSAAAGALWPLVCGVWLAKRVSR